MTKRGRTSRAARVTDLLPASPVPNGSPSEPWTTALGSAQPVVTRSLPNGLEVLSVQLSFLLWVGPRLSMSEDCNKRGGRVIGDRGELSCAEVEIVKRFRRAGWQSAWIQAFRCGRLSWGDYIGEPSDLPEHVQRIQRAAGTGGGHPDVVAWTAEKVVFVESKGPGDSLKGSQVDWFIRAVAGGQPARNIGLVEWAAEAVADA